MFKRHRIFDVQVIEGSPLYLVSAEGDSEQEGAKIGVINIKTNEIVVPIDMDDISKEKDGHVSFLRRELFIDDFGIADENKQKETRFDLSWDGKKSIFKQIEEVVVERGL